MKRKIVKVIGLSKDSKEKFKYLKNTGGGLFADFEVECVSCGKKGYCGASYGQFTTDPRWELIYPNSWNNIEKLLFCPECWDMKKFKFLDDVKCSLPWKKTYYSDESLDYETYKQGYNDCIERTKKNIEMLEDNLKEDSKYAKSR